MIPIIFLWTRHGNIDRVKLSRFAFKGQLPTPEQQRVAGNCSNCNVYVKDLNLPRTSYIVLGDCSEMGPWIIKDSYLSYLIMTLNYWLYKFIRMLCIQYLSQAKCGCRTCGDDPLESHHMMQVPQSASSVSLSLSYHPPAWQILKMGPNIVKHHRTSSLIKNWVQDLFLSSVLLSHELNASVGCFIKQIAVYKTDLTAVAKLSDIPEPDKIVKIRWPSVSCLSCWNA